MTLPRISLTMRDCARAHLSVGGSGSSGRDCPGVGVNRSIRLDLAILEELALVRLRGHVDEMRPCQQLSYQDDVQVHAQQFRGLLGA
jgi:hypothetical protein